MPFIGTFTHNRRTKAEYKEPGIVRATASGTTSDTTTFNIPRGIRRISVYAVGAGGGGGASNTAYEYNTFYSATEFISPTVNQGGTAGGGGGAVAANNVVVKYNDSVTLVGGGAGLGATRNQYTGPSNLQVLQVYNPGIASPGTPSKVYIGSDSANGLIAGGGTGGYRVTNSSASVPATVPGGSGSIAPTISVALGALTTTHTGGTGGHSQAAQYRGGGGGGAAGWNYDGTDGHYYIGPTTTDVTSVNQHWNNYYTSSGLKRSASALSTTDAPTAGGSGALQQTGGFVSELSLYGSPVTTPVEDLAAVDGTTSISVSPSTPIYGSVSTTEAGDYKTGQPTAITGYRLGGGAAGLRGRGSHSSGGVGREGGVLVKYGYGADFRYDNILQPAPFSQGGFNNVQYESDGVTLSPFSVSVSTPAVPVDEGSSKTYTISAVNPPSPSDTLYYKMYLEDSDGTESVAPSAELSPTSGSVTLSLAQATKEITVVEDETTEPLNDFMKMKVSATGTSGPWIATSNVTKINDTSQDPPPVPVGGVLLTSFSTTQYYIPSDDGISEVHIKAVGAGGLGGFTGSYVNYSSYSQSYRYTGGGAGGGGTIVVEGVPVSPGQEIEYQVAATPISYNTPSGSTMIKFKANPSTPYSTDLTFYAASGQNGTSTRYNQQGGAGGSGSGYTGPHAPRRLTATGGTGGPGIVRTGFPFPAVYNAGGGGAGGDNGGGSRTGGDGASASIYFQSADDGSFGAGGGGGVSEAAHSGYTTQSGGRGGGQAMGWPQATSISYNPIGTKQLGGRRKWVNGSIDTYDGPTSKNGAAGPGFANQTSDNRTHVYGGGGGGGGSTRTGAPGAIKIIWGDGTYIDASSPRAPAPVQSHPPAPPYA